MLLLCQWIANYVVLGAVAITCYQSSPVLSVLPHVVFPSSLLLPRGLLAFADRRPAPWSEEGDKSQLGWRFSAHDLVLFVARAITHPSFTLLEPELVFVVSPLPSPSSLNWNPVHLPLHIFSPSALNEPTRPYDKP